VGLPGVPFLDLHADYAAVRDDVLVRLDRVLASQTFVLGPQTLELEASLAKITGARHAVACSSGTDALVLALQACDVGAGDAVIVPAYTFFATAAAVRRVGALPVFCDVEAETFNVGERELREALDREFRAAADGSMRTRSGARLRAVIVVHLFGRAADVHALARVAGEAGALLVEDAAQAIGAATTDGPVGSRGAFGCFSFYPTKNLGGAGDGGAVTTGDDRAAARLLRLRAHGAGPDGGLHTECGLNARMSELQAAYLNAKLPRLASWTARRAQVAEAYALGLAPLAASGALALPSPAPMHAHVWHQYVVRVAQGRDRLRARLAERGIETRVYYPVPLHLEPCFADLGYRPGSLVVAERLVREALSLPIFPALAQRQIDAVCAAVRDALAA
jgi:dTDP-4-amino-4,6-dideoxygalactose transaminase